MPDNAEHQPAEFEHSDTPMTVTFHCGERELGFTLHDHRQVHDLAQLMTASRFSPFATVSTNTLAMVISAILLDLGDCPLGMPTGTPPSVDELAAGLEKAAAAGYRITLRREEVPSIFKEAFSDE